MSDSKSSSDGEKSDGSAEGSAAAGATEDETDTAAEGEESGDSVLADKILALEEEVQARQGRPKESTPLTHSRTHTIRFNALQPTNSTSHDY